MSAVTVLWILLFLGILCLGYYTGRCDINYKDPHWFAALLVIFLMAGGGLYGGFNPPRWVLDLAESYPQIGFWFAFAVFLVLWFAWYCGDFIGRRGSARLFNSDGESTF